MGNAPSIISDEEIIKLQKTRIIIFKDKYIYDLTKYTNEHPGGKNAILRNQGKNCNISYDFHSKQAQKLWKEYCIGILHHASLFIHNTTEA